ncbi:MAG: hypothetical protein HXY18_20320 [Bryobacteraceae bacterium]|nr:hypothetical protein [Bryobacteraceae bacterium]
MRTQILIGTAALMATSLLAASPKDEVKSAAKKLAESSGYAWKQTTDFGGGGQFRPGPTEGKITKDGVACVMMTRGDTTTEAFIKAGKVAVKTEEGWQTLEEAAPAGGGGGGGGGRGRFGLRMLSSFKAPAAQAEELADKTTDLKLADGAYTGELTEEGAKSLLTFGGRGGGGGQANVSGAKGSVKFWIKDGVLSKYEYRVQGTMSFGGNDRDVDRTTTVEIKDVGTTKVEVPEEAKKKLS